MNHKEILSQTDHRQWSIPQENWKYYQEWNQVIFLHWKVTLDELHKFVPDDLEIDLFEGHPWVSVVAFTMNKTRPRYLPPFYPISDFNEINIRTYVKSNNKSAVYFLSIEGEKWLSCKIAKGISELNYRQSRISRDHGEYRSYNKNNKDRLDLKFSLGAEVKKKSELDKWLTERYALFHVSDTSIIEYDVHHLEWPIREMEIQHFEMDYPRFSNLIKGNPHKIQYSEGVQVLTWIKKKRERL